MAVPNGDVEIRPRMFRSLFQKSPFSVNPTSNDWGNIFAPFTPIRPEFKIATPFPSSTLGYCKLIVDNKVPAKGSRFPNYPYPSLHFLFLPPSTFGPSPFKETLL